LFSTGKFFWKVKLVIAFPAAGSELLPVLGIRDATNIPLNLEANWILK
jgi:hypothetical protein